MAKVYLNPFGRFNRVTVAQQDGGAVINGNYVPFPARKSDEAGDGAQVLDGACSQDRVNIAATGAFNNASANLTVADGTDYVQVVTDGTIFVWAGKADVAAATKQSRAIAVAAGTYTFDVRSGDSVYVWSAT